MVGAREEPVGVNRVNVSVQRALPGSRSGPTMKTFNFFIENKIIGDPY